MKNKYLFFYKDAENSKEKFSKQYKDKVGDFLLEYHFEIFVKRKFIYNITDIHTKFDKNNNPFTIITYIDESGEIQYTKFNKEIHKII